MSSAEMDFHLRVAPYVRNVVWFNALPLAGEGTYTFRIAVKAGKQWRAVGEASYELSYQKPATGQKVRLQ
ncbi:MAG: hypothetical protein KGO02_24075 [Alphaproteobacteria bacterium]|nr:hypothetical protein [Alphaproteobacteria bacterium]